MIWIISLIKNTSAIKYPRTIFRFQVLNLIPKSRLVPTDRDLIPAAWFKYPARLLDLENFECIGVRGRFR
jgi:hypothetical protein